MKLIARKYWAAAAVVSLLSACGGGGGSSSGSANSSLSGQTADVLARSAVDTGNSATQFSTATQQAASAASAPSEKSVVPKAVVVTDCASNPQFSTLCAGQFTVNTNFTVGTNATIPSGSTLNMSFLGFRPLSLPAAQAVTGTVAITFNTPFSTTGTLNGSAQIKVDMISPPPEVHTNGSIAFQNMSVSGSGSDRTLSGAATVTSTGLPAMTVTFSNWHNIGSTPQAGSVAKVTAGSDTATVTVVSNSATQNVFSVTTTLAGTAPVTRQVVQTIANGQATYLVQ